MSENTVHGLEFSREDFAALCRRWNVAWAANGVRPACGGSSGGDQEATV